MNNLYHETPIVYSEFFSKISGADIYLKLENQQPCGSFKNRGIGHYCRLLKDNSHIRHFVSSSGGNAGLAVAYSGKQLNVNTTVIIPESTPSFMVNKISEMGAKVLIHGKNWNEADQRAREIAQAPDHAYISPFDHPLLWEGHASVIEEASHQMDKPDAIVLSVGGGGLLSGVYHGLIQVGWGSVPILTAETQGAASLALSIEQKERVVLDEIDTIATSLGAKSICEQAFLISQKHCLLPYVLTDQQALKACLTFYQHYHTLVEPACGASLALLTEKLIDSSQYQKVLVIVCGGSVVSFDLLKTWSENLGISHADL